MINRTFWVLILVFLLCSCATPGATMMRSEDVVVPVNRNAFNLGETVPSTGDWFWFIKPKLVWRAKYCTFEPCEAKYGVEQQSTLHEGVKIGCPAWANFVTDAGFNTTLGIPYASTTRMYLARETCKIELPGVEQERANQIILGALGLAVILFGILIYLIKTDKNR